MALDFGKRLLMEVEELGLGELLQDVRLLHDPSAANFAFPQLDRLVRRQKSSSLAKSPPIIELTSPSPGSGVTHLIYHITALAIIQPGHGGRHACVAICDTDNSFSVPRLVQQLQLLLPDLNQEDTRRTVEAALNHVHIFRPQSATSLLATLESLPDYLLHSQHASLNCPLAFIALDSASAFSWEMKAVEEDLAFNVHADASSPVTAEPTTATPASLTTALSRASRALSAPLILTSHALYPTQQYSQAQRSTLPHPLSTLPTLRLQTQRVPVRKFASCLSITEALRESEQRRQVVERGDFWVSIAGESIGNSEKGFGFKIGTRGVEMPKADGEGDQRVSKERT